MSAGGLRLRRIALGILFGLAFAYACAVGAIYAAQRSLVFPAPDTFADMPGGYTRVALRTGDGLTLAAAWRAPAPGRRTVLFFHGNGDSWAGGALAVAALTEAGYGALLPEYRGYGANPGSPSEAGFYADARAAMAWLGDQGIAPGQVVIVGNSLGGGAATQLALESRPAGLALVSAFTAMGDVAAEKMPWLPARLMVKDRFANAEKLGQIKAPVLILHGTADSMVLPHHARALARAQPRARLVLVPGADHDLAWKPAGQQALLDWADRLAQPAP